MAITSFQSDILPSEEVGKCVSHPRRCQCPLSAGVNDVERIGARQNPVNRISIVNPGTAVASRRCFS